LLPFQSTRRRWPPRQRTFTQVPGSIRSTNTTYYTTSPAECKPESILFQQVSTSAMPGQAGCHGAWQGHVKALLLGSPFYRTNGSFGRGAGGGQGKDRGGFARGGTSPEAENPNPKEGGGACCRGRGRGSCQRSLALVQLRMPAV
jgi:hypothetical protein